MQLCELIAPTYCMMMIIQDSIMYMRENCGIFTNFVWLSEHIKMNCFC